MDKTQYLKKDATRCMKGWFAVFVLIHHLYQYSDIVENPYIGRVFQAMGYLSVGMFFFFTGYGLLVSSKKQGYLEGFLKNRVLPLYAFYVILIVLYTAESLVLGNGFSGFDFIQSFLWGKSYEGGGWYFQVTFLVYLLFYVVFKLFKGVSKRIVAFCCALIIYCAVCAVCGFASTWYESVLCVSLGMLWAEKKDFIDKNLEKHPFLLTLTSGALFLVCFAGSLILEFKIFKIMTALFFVAAFASFSFLLSGTPIICNRLSRRLGDYSLEIYASQGLFLTLGKANLQIFENPLVFIAAVIIGTAVTSYLLKFLYTALNKKLHKQPKAV